MKRMLLVDDNQDARQALRMVLESQGLECAEVFNGSAALEWLEKQRADLIVTDNKMPILTGMEFIERLAQSPNNSRPPIITLERKLK